MKTLTCILTMLLFKVTFASLSFAEWTKVSTNVLGDVRYVDYKTLKIVENFRFFYRLTDYIEPTVYGDLSSKVYEKVNCNNLNYMYLMANYYSEPLGMGKPSSGSGIPKNQKWLVTKPGSIGETMRKNICKLKE